MRIFVFPVLLGSLGLGLAGCEMPVDEAAEEAVASSEAAILPLPPPRWANIPLLLPALEVHVCDQADAGTDDYVKANFSVGTSNSGEFILDNPGNDFERNGTYTFYLTTLGGGAKAQFNDLRAFEITKDGRDGLCIDRVALKMHGAKVWEYKASESHGGKFLMPMGGNGAIWLDAVSDDGGLGNSVRFSDVDIKYDDASRHGPIDVQILTCDETDASTDDTVRLRLWHDGIAEPVFKLDFDDFNDFERGRQVTYRISDFEAIEKIDKIRIEKKGTDGWCADTVRVFANGHLVFDRRVHQWLDSDEEDGWDNFETATSVTVETGSRTGHLGRAIGRADFAGDLDARFASSPDVPNAACAPPPQLTRTNLEGIIKTMVAAKLKSNSAFWDPSGYVTVTKKDSNSVRAGIRFEKAAHGIGNSVFWISFDVNVSCGDPDPDDDRDVTALVLDVSNMSHDYDLPPLDSGLKWFAELVSSWDPEAQLRKVATIDPLAYDVPGCPGITIDADADVHLDWDTIPVNGMCRKNNSP